jgi:hypothetical protein
MRMPARSRKGLGILGVLICVGFLAVIVVGLTVSLAGLTLRSSRYAESVRARALAQAGVEAAFAKLFSSPDAQIHPFSFELDGGRCSVGILRAEELRRAYSAEAAAKAGSGFDPLAKADKESGRLEVVSDGELRLAGGRMNCRITLAVRLTGAGGRKSIHVLSRTEETRYVRVEARPKPG